MRNHSAARTSRLAALLAGAALFAFGVDAAVGQTGPKRFERTYDARIVLSVTTTAPDTVFLEKATHTYRRVRILFIESAGLVTAIPADYAKSPANGVMSGRVAYQRTGSTPCTDSKRFSGPARMEIGASRSISAVGGWAGPPGGAELNAGSKRKCRDVIEVGGGHVWDYQKGRIYAQASSEDGLVGWALTRRPIRGRLPFPLDRLYAGKSFAAKVSGTTNDGSFVRQGAIRVTFTARP